jgi:hypothetical protein
MTLNVFFQYPPLIYDGFGYRIELPAADAENGFFVGEGAVSPDSGHGLLVSGHLSLVIGIGYHATTCHLE